MPLITRFSPNHIPGNPNPSHPPTSRASGATGPFAFSSAIVLIHRGLLSARQLLQEDYSQIYFHQEHTFMNLSQKCFLILNSTEILQYVLHCKKSTYSPFSLFMIVTLPKITEKTESLFLGEIKTDVSKNFGYDIFLTRSIDNLVLCVLRFQDILFSVYC